MALAAVSRWPHYRHFPLAEAARWHTSKKARATRPEGTLQSDLLRLFMIFGGSLAVTLLFVTAAIVVTGAPIIRREILNGEHGLAILRLISMMAFCGCCISLSVAAMDFSLASKYGGVPDDGARDGKYFVHARGGERTEVSKDVWDTLRLSERIALYSGIACFAFALVFVSVSMVLKKKYGFRFSRYGGGLAATDLIQEPANDKH